MAVSPEQLLDRFAALPPDAQREAVHCDAENRFKALASRGDKQRGLDLLKKLQKHYDD